MRGKRELGSADRNKSVMQKHVGSRGRVEGRGDGWGGQRDE